METLPGFEFSEDKLKHCPDCGEDKPLSEFRKWGEGKEKTRYRHTCKLCEKAYNTNLANLRKYAGPKPDACECCGKVAKKIAVDHDHNTNKIRGWLCIDCNTGIAFLGDNMRGLENAIKYMKKSENA